MMTTKGVVPFWVGRETDVEGPVLARVWIHEIEAPFRKGWGLRLRVGRTAVAVGVCKHADPPARGFSLGFDHQIGYAEPVDGESGQAFYLADSHLPWDPPSTIDLWPPPDSALADQLGEVVQTIIERPVTDDEFAEWWADDEDGAGEPEPGVQGAPGADGGGDGGDDS
jgi:hypothetical protein